MKIRPVVAQ